MELPTYKKNKRKFYSAAILILGITTLLVNNRAYSQIDYNYNRNLKGIRLSAGVGFAFLQTHFSQNPTIANFVGNLDYDFNPYFSIGGEGQVGYLQGLDGKKTLPYRASTNQYITANLNAKVALGLIYDFQAETFLRDALKRLYVGAGVGMIKNKIELKDPYDLTITAYNTSTNGKSFIYPFSFGTNIDLLGLIKKDRFVINPEYQFAVIDSPYADGYITSAASKTKVGYYTIMSIKLKYKF